MGLWMVGVNPGLVDNLFATAESRLTPRADIAFSRELDPLD